METNILKIITDALEQYHTEAFYKTRVFIEPQKLALFKKVTIELYEIPKFGKTKMILFVSSIEKISNEEEKQTALDKAAINLLSLTFKYISNEVI